MVMRVVMPFIEQFAIDAILGQKAPISRKKKLGLGLIVLSGFLLLIALAFLSLAAYQELQIYYAPTAAALIISGLVFVLSLCTGLIAYLSLKKREHQYFLKKQQLSEIITEFGEMVGDEIDAPIRENPKTAMMLASLAGFMAGDRLH